MSTSSTVFEKVAAREMSPEDGANVLMGERTKTPRRPGWMPPWVYICLVAAIAIVFAPVLSNRDR